MYLTPMPSKKEGYFIVPTCPKLAVNHDGLVILEESGKRLKARQRKNPFVYPYVVLGVKTLHVHRLVAETFLDSSGFINPIVNHKDAVKYHNQVTNLEWTDHSGNITHAYQNGLRDDNHPVLVKDLRTGEVSRFYSIGECGRHFKTSPAMIFHQLRPINFGKVYRDYYLLIREGQTWPPVGPEAIGLYRNGTAKEVGVYSDVGKNLIIFNSASEAAQFLTVSHAAVTKWLRKAVSRPTRYHQYREWKIGLKRDIVDRFKEVVVQHHEKKTWERKRREALRIRVTDLQTGSIRELHSLKVLADELGVKKHAIQKQIWSTDGTWRNRFHIKYLT